MKKKIIVLQFICHNKLLYLIILLMNLVETFSKMFYACFVNVNREYFFHFAFLSVCAFNETDTSVARGWISKTTCLVYWSAKQRLCNFYFHSRIIWLKVKGLFIRIILNKAKCHSTKFSSHLEKINSPIKMSKQRWSGLSQS